MGLVFAVWNFDWVEVWRGVRLFCRVIRVGSGSFDCVYRQVGEFFRGVCLELRLNWRRALLLLPWVTHRNLLQRDSGASWDGGRLSGCWSWACVVPVAALVGGVLLLPTAYLVPFLAKYGGYPSAAVMRSVVSPTVCADLPFGVSGIRRPAFPSCSMGVVSFNTGPSNVALGAGTVGSTVRRIGTGKNNGIVVPRNL